MFRKASAQRSARLWKPLSKRFELAAESVNQEAFVDAPPSAELVCINSALSTAWSEMKKFKISRLCYSRSMTRWTAIFKRDLRSFGGKERHR